MKSTVLILAVCGLLAALRSPAATPSANTADSFNIDPVHSSLVFRIRHSDLFHFYGRFNGLSGSFDVDESDPAGMKFDVTVETGTVDTGNSRRDGHLRSADFFSAKQHPQIKFKSTRVEKGKGKKYRIHGDLTLRGVTKQIAVEAEYGGQRASRGGQRAGFDGTFTIKRQDFGITFAEDTLGSEVTIMMGLTGTKK